jgi:hypothetical protein
MSLHQNAGKNHNFLIANKYFENVTKLKYLRMTVMNQNSTHEEIRRSLNSRNAYYHSVQNLLSSCLLSKRLKAKNYNTICCFVWVWNLVSHTMGIT